MVAALALVDKVSAYKGLSTKNTIYLPLLAEETMALMRSITGNVNGEFWIEDEDQVYRLHLKVTSLVDEKGGNSCSPPPTAEKTRQRMALWERFALSLSHRPAGPCFLLDLAAV